jgi:hypothetical protein
MAAAPRPDATRLDGREELPRETAAVKGFLEGLLAIGAGVAVLLVAFVVLPPLTPGRPGPLPADRLADADPPPAAADTPEDQRPYRLVVHKVEVAPTKADGLAWDGGALGFTRPDPYVHVRRADRVLEKRVAALRAEAAPLEARESARARLAELRTRSEGLPEGDRRRAGYGRQIAQLERRHPPLSAEEEKRLRRLNEEAGALRRQFTHTTRVVQDRHVAVFDEDAISVAEGDRVSIGVWDKDVAADDRVGVTKLTVTRAMLDEGRVVLAFEQVRSLELRFRKR